MCYTTVGVFPAMVILSMVRTSPVTKTHLFERNRNLIYVLILFLRLTGRVCASCWLVVGVTCWGWCSLKVTELCHSHMPYGICLLPWGRASITTPSGTTCTHLEINKSALLGDTQTHTHTTQVTWGCCKNMMIQHEGEQYLILNFTIFCAVLSHTASRDSFLAANIVKLNVHKP